MTSSRNQEVQPAVKSSACDVCNQPLRPISSGMCKSCYGAWYRAGKPDRASWAVVRRRGLDEPRGTGVRKCAVCRRLTSTPAHGMCGACWVAWARAGKPDRMNGQHRGGPSSGVASVWSASHRATGCPSAWTGVATWLGGMRAGPTLTSGCLPDAGRSLTVARRETAVAVLVAHLYSDPRAGRRVGP